MTPEQKQVLAEAIKVFGAQGQIQTMAVEELAELTQAITKATRAGIIKPWGIKPPCQESSMAEIEAYNNLCEEAADVEIMLEQIKLMLNPEFFQIRLDRKIKRLQETIYKHKQP